MPSTEDDDVVSHKQNKAKISSAKIEMSGENNHSNVRLVADSSMFLDMQVALLSFLKTYDSVYSPRGYQDPAIAGCAHAARLALKELASHTQEG